MKKYLKTLYRKSEFEPTFLGLLLNPFYISRKELRNSIRKNQSHLTGKLLDVGCGTMPYRKIIEVTEYVGLDIDTPTTRTYGAADVLYPGGRFPFTDNSFDSLFSSQVLEHVFEPNEFVSEISRVLKPGGHLLLTVPFVWEEHETPFDYGRYTSYGIEHLLKNHGFTVLNKEKCATGLVAICQLFLAHHLSTPSKSKYLSLVKKLLFCPIPNILSLVLPERKTPTLYLDNVIVARKN